MNPYDDIINLPHHVSTKRPQMSMSDRAAQFSPFAALTGYSDAVEETSRLTDEKIELDESLKSVLDMKQRILMDSVSKHPEITVTYFKKDDKKAGGKYLTVTGNLKKLDEYECDIIFTSGVKIPFNDIVDISSDLFREISDIYD